MNENDNDLNRFCAEKVMGWTRIDNLLRINSGMFAVGKTDGEIIIPEGNSFTRITTFNPAGDPAAAMAVLEKCAEKISTASIELYLGVDEGPEYKPVWCICRVGEREVICAKTLTLAICRFAKKLYS